MDAKSIRGYARAERALMDALENASAHVPENMFDECCEDPRGALAKLHRLARTNGVRTSALERTLSEALAEVDPDADGELTMEDQGTFILAWYAAEGWQPDTLTVAEAAREAGVSTAAIRQALEAEPEKVGHGKIHATKPRGRWLIDRESFDRWMAERGR